MKSVYLTGAICLACFCSAGALAQDSNSPQSSPTNPEQNPVLKHRAAEGPETPKPFMTENIDLTVPQGYALEVAVDREIRVQKVGQRIHGHLIESVYTFDKLVLPAGTEVFGEISQIERVSAGRRTLAALDANFTPTRKFTIEFNELSLVGGKHIPIQTTVAPGSGRVMRLVTAAENQKKKALETVWRKRKEQQRPKREGNLSRRCDK